MLNRIKSDHFCFQKFPLLSSDLKNVLTKHFPKTQPRRNFSLVARYSLKFTRCSLLIVKTFVTRCKISLLLVAEVARCKKSLVTHCRSCLMQNITRYSLQNSLVTRCEIHSLLVAEVDRCKKSFLTRSEKNLGTKVNKVNKDR